MCCSKDLARTGNL
ncbi:hypothetical protein F383_37936 [Gossypium arboreum]|nr:hypothetical protein F383_37936 [Gossypium arboreum]